MSVDRTSLTRIASVLKRVGSGIGRDGSSVAGSGICDSELLSMRALVR